MRLARGMQSDGAMLVDVREPAEHALGLPAGALAVPLGEVESQAWQAPSDFDSPIIFICATGKRSVLAAQSLSDRGYRRIYSVAGGFVAWAGEGIPVQNQPANDDFLDRYARHLRLPQVGLEGQQRLAGSRVLMVGAGGLGSPAAFYLAAAGVGHIRLVDDDVVERSNLQRQILHTEATIGSPKVESAQRILSALNPTVAIEPRKARLDAANVESLIADVDVVVDGADNFPTRYLLSDTCVMLRKPLVYGAVHRFEGQVSVFDAGRHPGVAPCYRCLFPHAPYAEDAPNCSEAGVLGVLPGVIGMLQATETLKLLLGIGEPLTGRLLHFDALSMRFRETSLGPDPGCAVCSKLIEKSAPDA